MMVISEGRRVASVFYRRVYTLCDSLLALPSRLSDGCIVPEATGKGGRLEVLGVTVLQGWQEGQGMFDCDLNHWIARVLAPDLAADS
jgi:hypothetical protein